MPYRILIVEDEADLVDMLEYNLAQNGYETCSALTGHDALKHVEEEPSPDLVLLDLMLPDMSGVEVCRMLQSSPRTASIPVLMLTAKGDEIDRVVGFEVGADDYVGCMEIEPDAYQVRVKGSVVPLSATEFRLLSVLLENRGRVQTRGVLLDKVWDIHADVQMRTVDVHVKRLREKLGDAGQYIQTVRGVGYRIPVRVDEEAR